MQLRLLIQTNEDLIYKGLFRILISTQTIFDLFGKKSCNINIITRKTIPCLKTQILFVLLSKKRLKCLAKLCIIPVFKHCLNQLYILRPCIVILIIEFIFVKLLNCFVPRSHMSICVKHVFSHMYIIYIFYSFKQKQKLFANMSCSFELESIPSLDFTTNITEYNIYMYLLVNFVKNSHVIHFESDSAYGNV